MIIHTLLVTIGWATAILAGLAMLVWLSRHIELSLAIRNDPALRSDTYPPPDPAGHLQDWPMISVLVAAKDEAACIEQCLRSMLDQDYPNYEVILINDRSSDQTGAIAERIAAENPRLRVIHVSEGELEAGWFGKNNAMRLGVQAARGQWFCFIDADCTQTSRSTLWQAFQHARAHDSNFLSILPRLIAHGFWEQVLQPVCGGILIFWFKPTRVNNPAKQTAYANGAFMMITKDEYWRVGGHEPVKAEVNEDIHLARLAKQAGAKLRVVQNGDLYTTRMYSGFAQTWRGWSRIFFGSFASRRRLVISLLVMLIMGVLPYVSAGVGLAMLALGAGGSLPWVMTIAGLASAAAQQSVLVRFYPLTGISPKFTITYALGAAVGIAIMVNAIRKVGGRSAVVWRGTTYLGKRRVA